MPIAPPDTSRHRPPPSPKLPVHCHSCSPFNNHSIYQVLLLLSSSSSAPAAIAVDGFDFIRGCTFLVGSAEAPHLLAGASIVAAAVPLCAAHCCCMLLLLIFFFASLRIIYCCWKMFTHNSALTWLQLVQKTNFISLAAFAGFPFWPRALLCVFVCVWVRLLCGLSEWVSAEC